ncbi:MAG: ATP-binding protein, partial [bacterium]
QVILSNISLLRMGIEPAPAREEILARIENRVKHGESLTGQLLGFARGGKYQVKAANLAPLVANAADMFGASHQEIVIQQNLEPALWNVRCDEGQIEQVLLNLFVNAQQAMAGGGRLILQGENVTLGSEFSEVHDAAPGRYVKISVGDSGTGMGQETLARVFEPFFTTKEMAHGSGLGLSSTYGIVRNHDGIITVDSEIGRGTTFDIYLPATDEQIEEIKQSPPVKTPKGEGTVLFVDDEEGLVYGGRRELVILGYDALVANSGREAIEVYRKNIGKVDLVILDMIMPGMGGGEVFDKLKELDPNVKVILSSGYSLAGEAEEIIARGCDAFLQKPFDMNELAGKIHEVLHQG